MKITFEELIWGRNVTGEIAVHGFTVILGDTLRMGAHELYEADETVYNAVMAIARERANEAAERNAREREELSRWKAAQ